jgi:malonate-semialdehyde dehydrogenase (acetylating)/methylmalonate-semialdehyde dehydrogenase
MADDQTNTKRITHWIDGRAWDGPRRRAGDVFNPATGRVSGRVDLASAAEVDAAVASASAAFPQWRQTSLTARTQVLFAFRELLNARKEELAAIITAEHGKVLSDALGEVTRGLEVVEFACGIPHLLKGGFSESVSTRVDVYSIRQPVGVVGIISPFNFPAMVPMWFFPVAIACGNTVVLKPSEKDPSAALWVARLWQEAGLPDGVFNVVHGDKEAVDRLLEHQDVRSVSFVGSTPIARYVYENGTRDCDMGPLVTEAHRDKVASYLDAGTAAGAELVVDGREHKIDGADEGFWLGPTLFDQVRPEMSLYTEEIFGPVLSVLRVDTYDEALALVNGNPYGNGTAIFTNDGGAARRYQNEVEVGMVGINVPIPVPMAYYSFGGWKHSLFGDSHAHGMEGVHFFTRGKVVTSRWLDPADRAGAGGRDGAVNAVNLGFPTHD